MKLVHIEKLRPGMVVGKDVPAPDNPIPLVRRDTVLTRYMIQEMVERGVRHAYVKERVAPGRDNPPAGRPAAAINPYPVHKKPPTITPALRTQAVDRLQNLFTAVGSGEIHSSAQIIRNVDEVVGQLVNTMQQDPGALVNISDLKSYDEYTYHHSLSVAVLTIAIGQHFGYDRKELNELGKCAILHDIGKTAVPIEIIHKPSKLDDREFAIIKGHSAAGYDYLKNASIGDDDILDGVRGHHEKVDGTGYPDGRKGEEISIWSRIISVADVYDALTSDRPYRSPMQPSDALEYIMGGVGTSFDYDVVMAFMQRVELYPVGSFIELSNGKTGVVINNENSMRPIIRILETGDVVDLYSDHSYLSVVITRLLPDPVAVGAKRD